MASVTKLMTLLLTFEALQDGSITLEDQVTVSKAAAGQIGSQALLDAGAVYSLKELLKSTIIASANDSAYALAEYLAGTETEFVARMNERAPGAGHDGHRIRQLHRSAGAGAAHHRPGCGAALLRSVYSPGVFLLRRGVDGHADPSQRPG